MVCALTFVAVVSPMTESRNLSALNASMDRSSLREVGCWARFKASGKVTSALMALAYSIAEGVTFLTVSPKRIATVRDILMYLLRI